MKIIQILNAPGYPPEFLHDIKLAQIMVSKMQQNSKMLLRW